MKMLFFCPMWGSSHLPLESFLDQVKQAGYDGIETGLPVHQPAQVERILAALNQRGLQFIAQHHETSNPDPEAHLAEYCDRLQKLAAAHPLLINSQTGKDWFTFEQNQRLVAAAHRIAEQSGVRILHETHRGKFSFCAQTTARHLETDPNLRLAADFSHWCVVSESLLEHQDAAMSLAISRVDHLHTRVGHSEGPQVSDPRAPEWDKALQAHLGWWDRVVAAHRQKGSGALTLTTEFGPVPYMPTLPYTGQPVANQWEINLYMLNLLRQRYS